MDITLPPKPASGSPVFSKLRVKDAMRKQVVALGNEDTVAAAIRLLIKHKTDSLLIANDEQPAGAITITDIMGAYYAALPPSTPLPDIMATPVVGCHPEDSLESALTTMQHNLIHRVYVLDDNNLAVGTLSYPDIVGTLYRYCHNCPLGLRKRTRESGEQIRFLVKDVMTHSLVTLSEKNVIGEAIEHLSTFRIGALIVQSLQNTPVGVLSKTDIALAYARGVPLEQPISTILKSPVVSCSEQTTLEEAIHRMILSEVSRLFCYRDSPASLTGVLTLSDTARMRSGSCQACSGSNIKI